MSSLDKRFRWDFPARYRSMTTAEKKFWWKEFLINNSLYFFIFIAIIFIQFRNPNFLASRSIVNVISLTAANLPIALGIAGCIVLTGTDLSAGRVVGITACVAASLLQTLDYSSKMYPGMAPIPIPVVLLIVIAIGAIVGLVNGFSVAKFALHPFIVTLATQLIVYGALLIYLQQGNNNGQSISGLTDGYKDIIKGSVISIAGIPIPN